ncbi:hypothetical protein O7635_22325 [Asanoa sp. WMMD1127]|uniref:hypothetical protein n=1 Tax=Asanoa sp. WMMD1127 TaxID=3016107 RepID=UPI002416D15B|nr:hypothetical protein [Asanoa sp. WMMD1127]MDG4824595.1 hypothetical protein [Asanoa sp. WMMD1127]
MSAVSVHNEGLTLRFSGWEQLFVRRAIEVVPLAAVSGADVVEGWLYRPLGVRAGLVVSGLLKVGTWRSPGITRLVCIRRGEPILRVTVDRRRSGGHFDELLIGTPDARSAADALNTHRVP